MTARTGYEIREGSQMIRERIRAADRLSLAEALGLRREIDSLRSGLALGERVAPSAQPVSRLIELDDELGQRDLRIRELHVADEPLRELTEADRRDAQVVQKLRDLALRKIEACCEKARVWFATHRGNPYRDGRGGQA